MSRLFNFQPNDLDESEGTNTVSLVKIECTCILFLGEQTVFFILVQMTLTFKAVTANSIQN